MEPSSTILVARNVVWNNSEKRPRYAWTYGCTFEEVSDLFIAFIADLLKTEVSKKLHICLGAHCSSCWNGNRTTHLTTCVLKIADVSQAQLRARLDYMRDSKEFNKVNPWAPFIPIDDDVIPQCNWNRQILSLVSNVQNRWELNEWDHTNRTCRF